MTKEQALEKKLEQVKWHFPNHVVFKKDNKVYHYDPNNFNEENIFTQTGLKVFKEEDGNVALYDPEYFRIDIAYLEYKGTAAEKIPQPINLKNYKWLFNWYRCETINLSDWDFSEVTNVTCMFQDSLVRTVVLGDVDFLKCERFARCFIGCNALEELILGNYKVLSKADLGDMFLSCNKLSGRYGKTTKELADIFKSGQWNSLQPVEAMEVF